MMYESRRQTAAVPTESSRNRAGYVLNRTDGTGIVAHTDEVCIQ